jgi:glutamyl-Q tRNA(Asp) synthetase
LQPVFRFAPSPTGYLHLGHALSALLDMSFAGRPAGGFSSGSRTSTRRAAVRSTKRRSTKTSRWLGLTWEEPVRRQSEHFPDYRAALDRLAAAGLIYPSFMSRAEIAAATADPAWPRDPDGSPLYPGAERDLTPAEIAGRIAAGAPRSERLAMDRALARAGPLSWTEEGFGEPRTIVANPAAWGDAVVARKDTPTSYHLSVVVDDAAEGVTHVVRGRDLYHATSVHVLLQSLLGLPSPVYHHHRLILDDDGRKLSKSDGSVSLRALRDAGKTPDDIRRMVGL